MKNLTQKKFLIVRIFNSKKFSLKKICIISKKTLTQNKKINSTKIFNSKKILMLWKKFVARNFLRLNTFWVRQSVFLGFNTFRVICFKVLKHLGLRKPDPLKYLVNKIYEYIFNEVH